MDSDEFRKQVQREYDRQQLEAKRAARKKQKLRAKEKQQFDSVPSQFSPGPKLNLNAVMRQHQNQKGAKKQNAKGATYAISGASMGYGGPPTEADGRPGVGKPNLKWKKAQAKQAKVEEPAPWRAELNGYVALGNRLIEAAAVEGGFVYENQKIQWATGQFAISGLVMQNDDERLPSPVPVTGKEGKRMGGRKAAAGNRPQQRLRDNRQGAPNLNPGYGRRAFASTCG
mmetsp:Transcript_45453/g.74066  ORF Transcript_45453/g.74066 Transcript_45453/m.74066 type:complete len:228 (-) Transcript_45453:167-850(-)